jgi:phosphoribosylglycinamide formyltransferase-1
MQLLKLVILISGNGSNLQAIIDAIQKGSLQAEISLVISAREEAYGLQRAKKAGIPCEILSAKIFPNRQDYDLALAKLIEIQQPDLIVLAGFMRILSREFIQQFEGKIINIHPSLLPRYPGLDTHQRVLTNQDIEHGCSIHFATEEVDGGPIIARASLQVLPNDTIATLQQRVHALEHQLYPLVLQWFSEQRILLTSAGVSLDNQLLPLEGRQIQF